MLGMALAGCSNDDMLGVDDLDDLDKLEQIEKPTTIGYHEISTVLTTYEKDKVNTHPVIKEDGDYTVYIFNSAEELAEAEIKGSSIPGISFNPDFTKPEYDEFRKECINSKKSVSVVEDFSDIDWSKQSLVFITRRYPTSALKLINVAGNVYRKDGSFIITFQAEILISAGLAYQAISYSGVAALIDKHNLSAKDLRIHLDNTEYNYNADGRYEKKSESKWLKL